MRQTRLEKYFLSSLQHEKSEKSGRTWLDLPLPVRKRIYAELGLLPKEGHQWPKILMNRYYVPFPRCRLGVEEPEPERECPRCGEQVRNRAYDQYYHSFCKCSPLPLHLAAVCRAARKDVTEVFFSEVHFLVVHSSHGKLSALENLSPLALSCLRNLTIRTTLPLTELKDESIAVPCHPICAPADYNQPLGARWPCRDEGNVIADVRRAIKHLAHHITPGRLKLNFVCDIQSWDGVNMNIVKLVLDGLLILPRLASCSIGLCERYCREVQPMAEETCLKLTGHTESRIYDPFPFRRLPHTLQMEVLRYTGLVSPHHLYYDPITNQPRVQHIRNPVAEHRCFYKWPAMERTIGHCCHCRDRCTGYSTSCFCMTFPSALFAVDQQMEQDARRLMYMENIWLLKPISSGSLRSQPHRSSYNMMRFMEYTHNLTLVCLGYLPDPKKPASAWRPWCELLETFAMVEPQRLALTILLDHPRDKHGRLPLDIDAYIWRQHNLALQAVWQSLQYGKYGKRYKDFFVSIRGNEAFFDDHVGIVEYTCPETHGDMEPWEMMMEKMIMGDDYDSRTRGKKGNIHQYGPDYYPGAHCEVCGRLDDPPWY